MRSASARLIRCCLLLACSAGVLWLPGCSGKQRRVSVPPATPTSASAPVDQPQPSAPDPSDAARQILATARSQLGRVYQWGGSTPQEGFDCSGFVQWVFAQHGYRLPRSTRQQISAGKSIPADRLKPGDLVFFARKPGSGKPHHVGIYEGRGRFIHSPSTGKRIQSSSVFGAYFGSRYLVGKRVLGEASPTGQVVDVSPGSTDLEVYTVRPGDYIWKIARKLKVSPWELLQLNDLSPDDVIKAGQRLLIPPRR